MRTWQAFRFPEMYAGILAMSILGLSLYFVVDALGRPCSRWLHIE